MTLAAESLVDAYARELATTEPGRLSLRYEEYTYAFRRVAPHLATAASRDDELGDVLAELEHRGLIHRSKRRGGGGHGLPARIVMLERTADPPVGDDVARFPWRPELAFAVRLPLRRSEFRDLQLIQAFLRDRSGDPPYVPLAERSLEVLGNEKRLDALLRTRLFGPGHLSLDLLAAYRCAPPFVHRRVGEGTAALVVENAATYHSVLATLASDSPVGTVVFGGGNGFATTIAFFAELRANGLAVEAIRYFGDLDPAGLNVPWSANLVGQSLGLPAVLPAPALYTHLLRCGRPGPAEGVRASHAARLVSWLPEELRAGAQAYLVAGQRLAQEAVGTALLERDTTWCSREGLGIA